MPTRTEALVEARAAHQIAANALERAILFQVSELFQLNYPGATTLTATTNREYDGSAAVTVETVVDAAGKVLFNIDNGAGQGDAESEEGQPDDESDIIQKIEVLLAELVEVKPGDCDKAHFELDLDDLH